MSVLADLVVAVFVFANAGWILAALLLAGVVHTLREMAAAAGRQRELAREAAAVVAARADEQQALVMAGDERGVYGEFPPVLAERIKR